MSDSAGISVTLMLVSDSVLSPLVGATVAFVVLPGRVSGDNVGTLILNTGDKVGTGADTGTGAVIGAFVR